MKVRLGGRRFGLDPAHDSVVVEPGDLQSDGANASAFARVKHGGIAGEQTEMGTM